MADSDDKSLGQKIGEAAVTAAIASSALTGVAAPVQPPASAPVTEQTQQAGEGVATQQDEANKESMSEAAKAADHANPTTTSEKK